MIELTKTVQISQFNKGYFVEVDDTVSLEYHLTLQINDQRQVTFSCTPQYLEEMLLGYLLSEGIVEDLSQVEHLNLSKDRHIADVWIKRENNISYKQPELRLLDDGTKFSLSGVVRQFARFTRESRIHRKTGGVHRAALCNDKETLLAVNDISRHNTVDKVT
jgi:FdhD protein